MRRCELVVKDGSVGFLCSSGPAPRLPPCAFCRKPNSGAKQCDYPLSTTKTCDAYACVDCSLHVEPDLDYCPIHKVKGAALR
jgi:hypothetical protein